MLEPSMRILGRAGKERLAKGLLQRFPCSGSCLSRHCFLVASLREWDHEGSSEGKGAISLLLSTPPTIRLPKP